MGWWPSILGGESTDPISKLDPKLREFLEKESPVKYTATPESSSKPQQQAPTPSAKLDTEDSVIPKASLYPDGRYAHLWKNYRPQAQIEEEAATEHDKLMNVLEGYQARKSAITRVAMENCAEQQEEWINCMKHGDWSDQLQMCRHQVRRFESCYTMQSRFLRALGYGSVPGRSAEVEEDIQMHADALYQRVLQHESAVEAAKKDGLPIPKFDPTIPKAIPVTYQPSEEIQEQWREKLEKLPEEERAVEEAALRADLQAKSETAKNYKGILEARRKAAKEPKPDGQGIGDAIAALLRGGK